MDFEKMLKEMADMDMKTRSGYHLTFGELVKALKSAPSNLVFDTRIKGIGSYRGYYSDIALFTAEQVKQITKRATLMQKIRLLFHKKHYVFDDGLLIEYKRMDGIIFVMKRSFKDIEKK